MSRTFDLVAYGATGFTGRQLAFWLRDHAPADLRWAVGGRSRPKLEQLVAELGVEVPIVVADCADADAVDAMVRDTRAVASTAGPFAQYGDPIVSACVNRRTDWLDITGETPWVRSLIDRFHDRAAAEGTRIVPFCGFDSIPSDLGVWMMARHAQTHFGEGLASVLATFRASGGVNGGTLASALTLAESGAGRMIGKPRLLCPPDADVGIVPDRRALAWDEDRQRWLAPFFMAPINTRVVRRTTALLAGTPARYGALVYDEAMETGSRAEGWAMLAGLGAFDQLLRRDLGRKLIARVVPAPGEGPTEAQMDGGFFRARLTATTTSGRRLQGMIVGKGDPGNRSTIRMLGASALTLLLDRDRLPAQAGVITPALAFGDLLVDRLRELGMRWEAGPLDLERLRAG